MKLSGTGVAVIILGISLGMVGCQREADSNAAIQSAIEQHLTNRPGISGDKLILEMKQVNVQGERAEAEVVFRSRDDPAAPMPFHYQLRREGGQWKVEGGRPNAAGSPHPTQESPSEGGEAMPPGHPPVQPPPPQP